MAAPASAATTWYASPDGSGAACTSGSPCPIQTALDGPTAKAGSGDTVVLLPGAAGAFYTVNDGAPVHVRHDVHVMGDPAGPRPLVKVDSPSAANFSFETDAANSTLSQVAFETSGFYPVTALARISVSEISVKGHSACLLLQGADSSLVDSTFDSALPSGSATATCLTAFANGIQIRNVDLTSAKDPGPPGAYDAAILLQGAGIHIDGLRVRSDTQAIRGGGGPADPLVLRRLDLRGTGIGVNLSYSVLTDSLVQMSGDHAIAVATSSEVLRNVSAIATGTGSQGLRVFASGGGQSLTTDVRNSIIRGDGKDVFMDPSVAGQGDPNCQPSDPFCIIYIPPQTAGTLVIGNSNYRTSEVSSGATLTDAGGNSAVDPLFVNPGAGDFHLSAGSPAIDAGADFAENGSLDLDAMPRKQGAGVDMGAYEFPFVAPVPDTDAPLVTGLGETNSVFAVGRAPTPVAARARRHKKGTTFVFKSSEAGTATLTISRARPGRRRGRRCVKPTRKNHRAKRCTRYTRVRPALLRTVTTGPTAVPFSGRIGTKALRPGKYRVSVVVADAAGNRSKPKSVAFRIVRR